MKVCRNCGNKGLRLSWPDRNGKTLIEVCTECENGKFAFEQLIELISGREMSQEEIDVLNRRF